MRRILPLPFLLVLVVAGTALGFDEFLTTCGQTVPDRKVGLLGNNLSCGGAFVGVTLGRGARLLLNGFTISDIADTGAAVLCTNGCKVVGPGEITAGHGDGIVVTGTGGGLHAGLVDIHDCHIGVRCTSPQGVTAFELTVENSASDGIQTPRLRGNIVFSDNNGGIGINAGTVVAYGLDANDNGEEGLRADRALLKGSYVERNNGSGAGIDISAARGLRLLHGACGKSQVTGQPLGTSWGLCVND